MRIPFDIKYRPQIESGEYKVETRDGRDARIICWDSKAKDARYDTKPIIALVTTPIPSLERLIQCGENGILYKYAEDRNDLFIVTPEEEMTEFEQVLKSGTNIYVEQGRRMEDWDAKQDAKELLSLAREQLKPEIDAAIEWAYKNADEVQYKKGWEDAIDDHREALRAEYEKGKADALKEIEQDPESSYAFKRGVEYGKEEALKGVPRWTKADRDMHVIRRCLVNWGGEIGTANFIPKDSYYIPIIDLEHLLREDSHE